MKKEQDRKERTRLTPEEYWEWRATVSELLHEQEKLRVCQLEHKLMQKDSELMGVRAQLFAKSRVEFVQEKVKAVRLSYEEHKKKLEGVLGISLNNKIIDDATHEVKDLPIEKD